MQLFEAQLTAVAIQATAPSSFDQLRGPGVLNNVAALAARGLGAHLRKDASLIT